jgi:hypothetical protein
VGADKRKRDGERARGARRRGARRGDRAPRGDPKFGQVAHIDPTHLGHQHRQHWRLHVGRAGEHGGDGRERGVDARGNEGARGGAELEAAGSGDADVLKGAPTERERARGARSDCVRGRGRQVAPRAAPSDDQRRIAAGSQSRCQGSVYRAHVVAERGASVDGHQNVARAQHAGSGRPGVDSPHFEHTRHAAGTVGAVKADWAQGQGGR